MCDEEVRWSDLEEQLSRIVSSIVMVPKFRLSVPHARYLCHASVHFYTLFLGAPDALLDVTGRSPIRYLR